MRAATRDEGQLVSASIRAGAREDADQMYVVALRKPRRLGDAFEGRWDHQTRGWPVDTPPMTALPDGGTDQAQRTQVTGHRGRETLYCPAAGHSFA